MKKIDPQTKRSIYIPSKFNDRDYKSLQVWKKIINETKDSTAIKKAVTVAKVLLAPISEEFEITLSPKKKGFSKEKLGDSI